MFGNLLKGSWKTTAAGVGGLLGVLIYGLHLLGVDIAIPASTAEAITLASVSWGLIVSRDNKVSSETVGAK